MVATAAEARAQVVMLVALQMLEEEEECRVVAAAEAERCLEEEAVLVAVALLQEEEVWTADPLAVAVPQVEKQEDQQEVVPHLSPRCQMVIRQARPLVAVLPLLNLRCQAVALEATHSQHPRLLQVVEVVLRQVNLAHFQALIMFPHRLHRLLSLFLPRRLRLPCPSRHNHLNRSHSLFNRSRSQSPYSQTLRLSRQSRNRNPRRHPSLLRAATAGTIVR